jgi:hypothetical protein
MGLLYLLELVDSVPLFQFDEEALLTKNSIWLNQLWLAELGQCGNAKICLINVPRNRYHRFSPLSAAGAQPSRVA